MIKNQGFLAIRNLLGTHIDGKNNFDVEAVSIVDCHMNTIPKCIIDRYFQNVQVLDIKRSSLKQLSKTDLIPFKNLQRISCFDNQITHLSGDLFEGFINLECIDFANNNLEIIEPNILDGLTKLKHVNFKGNRNFDKCFSTYPKFKPNATLMQIKDELNEKFFAKFKHMKALKDSNDKLSKEIEKLKKSIEIKNNQSSLIDDIKNMLNDENTKDLTIKVDSREFRVHKFVLASRSPFFEQMFKERPDVDILILEDLPYFELIVTYCYTDMFPIVPNFVNLLSVAGKLQMIKLRDFAASMAVNHMNDDNCVEIFGLCCKYGYNSPMKEAYIKIKEIYGKYINFKDEWLTKPNELISIIEGFKKQDEELKKFVKKFGNSSVMK